MMPKSMLNFLNLIAVLRFDWFNQNASRSNANTVSSNTGS